MHGREAAHDLPKRPRRDDGQVLVAIQERRGPQKVLRLLRPPAEQLAVTLQTGHRQTGQIIGGPSPLVTVLNSQHRVFPCQQGYPERDAKQFEAVLIAFTDLRRVLPKQIVKQPGTILQNIRNLFRQRQINDFLTAALLRLQFPQNRGQFAAKQRLQRTDGHAEPDIILEALLIIGRRITPAVDLKALREKKPRFHKIVQLPVLQRAETCWRISKRRLPMVLTASASREALGRRRRRTME